MTSRDRDGIEWSLRVLTCITSGAEPDPVDVQRLRGLAPDLEALPIVEVACLVIRRVIDDRLEAHKAAAS